MNELRDNLLKVTADHANRWVWIGDKAIRRPTLIRNWPTDIPILTGFKPSSGIARKGPRGQPNGTRDYNKQLTEYLGIPPKRFARIFNGVASSVWIRPVEWYVNRLARGFRGKVDMDRVERIWKYKAVLDEARKDGLDHLTPILLLAGRPPKDVRHRLGRSRWKRLAHNSLSRNALIARVGIKWMDLPSTALAHVTHMRCSPEALLWACNHRNAPLKDRQHLRELGSLYEDTQDMCRDIGESFNSRWSLRRMHEEHDRVSRAITAGRFSDEHFEELAHVIPLRVNCQDWTAQLLESPLDIAEEGRAMRHCIASYIGEVAHGEYAVFSIRNPAGERYSTLGLHIDLDPTGGYCRVETDDHRCAINHGVKDGCAHDVAEKARKALMKALNANSG